MNGFLHPDRQNLSQQLIASSVTLTERGQALSGLKVFTSSTGPAAERLKSDLRRLIWAMNNMASQLQGTLEQLKRSNGDTDQHL